MRSIPIRLALVLALASPAAAQTVQSSWTATKNASADNVYHDNDRYGEIDDALSPEQWPGCDVQHLRAASLIDHRFEPADCTKGDLARVWFYMHDQHGVVIPDEEWNMFVDWSEGDPVSPWELERDRRIAGVQGNNNPYVAGFEPDDRGACTWDPTVE